MLFTDQNNYCSIGEPQSQHGIDKQAYTKFDHSIKKFVSESVKFVLLNLVALVSMPSEVRGSHADGKSHT